MTGLLPPGMRCSSWWYAMHRGLPQDLAYLKGLGLAAARLARWEGLEEWKVPEGPDQVHMWPERIFDEAARHPAGVLREPGAPRDDFRGYPAPPEDTMAYADWCQMADEDARRERSEWGSCPGWANPYD